MSQSPFRFETPLSVSCPYYLGDGITDFLPAQLQAHAFDRCFLVTSRKLFNLFGRQLARQLRGARVSATVLLVGDGEDQKSWRSLQSLLERLVQARATKDSILLALGGGVVGNLAGLAAALLYRGVRYVEIPTTLMALTDSTLSNKQAINGRHGKNQFGVYHAPLFIWGDVQFARSEPIRQQRAGVVEGIKNVFVWGQSRADADPILAAFEAGDTLRLARLLIDSKLPILAADPTERGSAIALEYGHTFGHAIEWLAKGELFHGEAVAVGMCLAADLSHTLGLMSERFRAEHYQILGDRLGVPVHLPPNLSPEAVLELMHRDNKRSAKGLACLLLTDYGQFAEPTGDRQTRVAPGDMLELLQRARERRAQQASR